MPQKQLKLEFSRLFLHCGTVVLSLILFWYVKYWNQGLALNEFSLTNTGNLLNLLISMQYISIVTAGYFLKSNVMKTDRIFLWIIESGAVISLLVARVLSAVNLGNGMYIFGEPLYKISIVFFSAGFEIFYIYGIVFLSYRLFGAKSFLHLRSILSALLIVIALIGFIYYFGYNKYTVSHLGRKQYDTGIVFGAAVWSNNKPSPMLIQRVDKAIELYKNKTIRTIYLTGANAPGEITEAEAAYNYIKNSDVNLNDVYLEKQSTSTIDQVRFIKDDLLRNDQFKSILLISDIVHTRRIGEIVSFHQMHLDIAGTGNGIIHEKGFSYRFRECLALLIFWFFAL